MSFTTQTPLPRYRTRGALELVKSETLLLRTKCHASLEHAIEVDGSRPHTPTEFHLAGNLNFRREADAEFAAASWNFADACDLTVEDLRNPALREAVRALLRLVVRP